MYLARILDKGARNSEGKYFPLSLSLRGESPHVLSAAALWVLVLGGSGEAFGTAIPDFMGIRLVPLRIVPWYTIEWMRLYQTMERTARPHDPEDVQGSRARSDRHALHVEYLRSRAVLSRKLS